MKEVEDLKISVRKHVEKLEKKGLYLEQIYIEYTRRPDYSGSPTQQQPDQRKVVIKLSSDQNTSKLSPIWF